MAVMFISVFGIGSPECVPRIIHSLGAYCRPLGYSMCIIFITFKISVIRSDPVPDLVPGLVQGCQLQSNRPALIENGQSLELALLGGGAGMQSKAVETDARPTVNGVGGGQTAAPAARCLFTLDTRPRHLLRGIAAVVAKSVRVFPYQGQGFLAHIAFRAGVGQGQTTLYAAIAGYAQSVESGPTAQPRARKSTLNGPQFQIVAGAVPEIVG
jgi:hypothetical protein